MIDTIKIETFALKLKTLLIESVPNRTSPTISGYRTC
jgi:hypothetical protein